MDYFPVIDLIATGANIQCLRQSRGLTVGDLQQYFGFEQPQAIYKWQKGLCLPKVDHLYALGQLLGVPMEDILVPRGLELNKGTKKDEAFSPGGKVASSFWLSIIFIFQLQSADQHVPFKQEKCSSRFTLLQSNT